MNLEGKICVVTGANKGIGLECVKSFLEREKDNWKKAIEQDPNFWEAHVLAAELYERTLKYKEIGRAHV
jgi:NAD(P)-dependent dehydrogenase (short-subunit alcohol dehydrogenase family)